MSGLRLAAVTGPAAAILHPAAGGIQLRAVRNMVAAEASTVAAGTAVVGTAAVQLPRSPVTRVDAAALAARVDQPRTA
jgi:hypothetical protein